MDRKARDYYGRSTGRQRSGHRRRGRGNQRCAAVLRRSWESCGHQEEPVRRLSTHITVSNQIYKGRLKMFSDDLFSYQIKLAAPPSRAAGVVFQNDFVFVQKVADAVGLRPVFIGASLFPLGD